MNYFLTGGGEHEFFVKLEQKFFASLPKTASLALLPFACEEDEYEELYDDFQANVDKSKVKNIDLIQSIEQVDLEDFLAYDAIYIEGGNTFKLIKEIRNSNFNQYIKAFVKADKIIYADSAGAIVLGQDVQSAFIGELADEDESNIQNYRGLGLVGNWSIHCHAVDSDFDDLQDQLYETGHPFLALPEPTGIHIDGDRIEVFGNQALEILDFEGRRQVSVGQKISLAGLDE